MYVCRDQLMIKTERYKRMAKQQPSKNSAGSKALKAYIKTVPQGQTLHEREIT